MNYYIKQIWWNILSIIIGIFITGVIISPLQIILLALFGFTSFSNNPSNNLYVDIISLVLIFTGSAIGGYVTGLLSPKKQLLNVAITGAILTFWYFKYDDLKINNTFLHWIALLTIIPSTLLSGYMSNRNKD